MTQEQSGPAANGTAPNTTDQTDAPKGNGGSPPGMTEALALCPDLVMGKRDPFDFDRPANHIRAKWLADQIETLRPGKSIHLRGLNYLLLSAEVMIPATTGRYKARPYTNTSAGWLADTLKFARWLGCVPWERITDERSGVPVIRLRRPSSEPRGWLSSPSAYDVTVPDVTAPYPVCMGLAAEQPYRIVLGGEKPSLRDVLEPISEKYGTDLFLCPGDLSDARVAELAAAAAADGRHVVILWFADCDPQGFNMAITLCRKLAAHKYNSYPELSWQVHRVALTPDQVRNIRPKLPECELKGSVKQARLWRERNGVEQTEIDALAALRPDVLTRMTLDMLANFCDLTLADSAWWADMRWSKRVRELVAERLDQTVITAVNADLARLRSEIGAVYRRARAAAAAIELPPLPDQITPRLPETTPEPLCDSRWSFAEQTRRLIADKQYEDE